MADLIKWVELPNKLKIPYWEQGNLLGVSIILLHGLADSWHTFELLLPHFPDFMHVIALDQRGHGNASRPEHGYRTDDFLADLIMFMDALDIQLAVLLGASSGGVNFINDIAPGSAFSNRTDFIQQPI